MYNDRNYYSTRSHGASGAISDWRNLKFTNVYSAHQYNPSSSIERLNSSPTSSSSTLNRGKDGIFRPKSIFSVATEIDFDLSHRRHRSSPSAMIINPSPIQTNPRLAHLHHHHHHRHYREPSLTRNSPSPSGRHTPTDFYSNFNDNLSYGRSNYSSSPSSSSYIKTNNSYVPNSSYRFTKAYYAPKYRERPLLSNLNLKFSTKPPVPSTSPVSTTNGGLVRSSGSSGSGKGSNSSSLNNTNTKTSTTPTSSHNNSVSSTDSGSHKSPANAPALERNKFLIKFREANAGNELTGKRRTPSISWDIPFDHVPPPPSTTADIPDSITEAPELETPTSPKSPPEVVIATSSCDDKAKEESPCINQKNPSLTRWKGSFNLSQDGNYETFNGEQRPCKDVEKREQILLKENIVIIDNNELHVSEHLGQQLIQKQQLKIPMKSEDLVKMKPLKNFVDNNNQKPMENGEIKPNQVPESKNKTDPEQKKRVLKTKSLKLPGKKKADKQQKQPSTPQPMQMTEMLIDFIGDGKKAEMKVKGKQKNLIAKSSSSSQVIIQDQSDKSKEKLVDPKIKPKDKKCKSPTPLPSPKEIVHMFTTEAITPTQMTEPESPNFSQTSLPPKQKKPLKKSATSQLPLPSPQSSNTQSATAPSSPSTLLPPTPSFDGKKNNKSKSITDAPLVVNKEKLQDKVAPTKKTDIKLEKPKNLELSTFDVPAELQQPVSPKTSKVKKAISPKSPKLETDKHEKVVGTPKSPTPVPQSIPSNSISPKSPEIIISNVEETTPTSNEIVKITPPKSPPVKQLKKTKFSFNNVSVEVSAKEQPIENKTNLTPKESSSSSGVIEPKSPKEFGKKKPQLSPSHSLIEPATTTTLTPSTPKIKKENIEKCSVVTEKLLPELKQTPISPTQTVATSKNVEEPARKKNKIKTSTSDDSSVNKSPTIPEPAKSKENQEKSEKFAKKCQADDLAANRSNSEKDSASGTAERLHVKITGDPFQRQGRNPHQKKIRFREYSIDDFQFLTVLGRGSFGKVLLAELINHECHFAVKCLKKQTVIEDDDVESIMIERKVLAYGTSHPFICKLFCTFQTESHLFFAMELCSGGDLMFHVQKEGKFPENKVKFYASEILCAIWFLHKRGIIYRDLKLDNVMVANDGHIRLVDFGMCVGKMYREEFLPSNFCGTPEYMAPEIIKGVKYNHSVDYWALGVVIYEMCVGTSPFHGTDEDELLWNVCNTEVHYPKFLSEQVKTLCVLLLKKNPQERLGMPDCPYGEIVTQPWFHGVQWDLVEKCKIKPPFIPQLAHDADVSYFDQYFTKETPGITPCDKPVNENDQLLFQGFNYTNHRMTD